MSPWRPFSGSRKSRKHSTRKPPASLGQAFDMACALLGRTPQPTAVREAIAKSIIEAAKAGERDPVRLREAGLAALSNSNAA